MTTPPLRRLALATALLAVVGGCVSLEKGKGPSQPLEVHADGMRLTPTVHIGRCAAAKIGPRHFAIAAHCLRQTESSKLHIAYVPGVKARVRTSLGGEEEVTIATTAAHPQADIAVLSVTELTPSVPTANLGVSSLRAGDKVTIGGFGCDFDAEAGRPASHGSASIVGVQGMSAVVAEPNPSASERLCAGDDGGPVYVEGRGGLRIVALAQGRTNGQLQAARIDDESPAKASAWTQRQLAQAIPPPPKVELVFLKCQQTLTLLTDGVLRDYVVEDLKLALDPAQHVLASSDRVQIGIKPDPDAGQLPYSVQVVAGKECAPGALCYHGIYQDAFTGETRAVMLQMRDGIVSVAHFTAAESAANLTELDAGSCAFAPAE